MIELMLIAAIVLLAFEVLRLRHICNKLLVTATHDEIRARRVVLTDETDAVRYSISLADNPENQAIRELLRSRQVPVPDFPPMLQVKAADSTVLTIDNHDSIRFYAGRIYLHADSVVISDSEATDTASDLAVQVELMNEPMVDPMAPGNVYGAEYCSTGVTLHRGEPEVWVWRKGERRPQLQLFPQ